LSGGGYWQPRSALDSTVWSPDKYSLIAIQSHWWERGRYLQATQIIHWLRLLWAKREDVRVALSNAFPNQAFAAA
jgi:hypothetical protein